VTGGPGVPVVFLVQYKWLLHTKLKELAPWLPQTHWTDLLRPFARSSMLEPFYRYHVTSLQRDALV
jgi:hypothetical protein